MAQNVERVPMTPEGFEKLRRELDHLKSKERPKIILEIEEAMAHGDLSENAEYHAAKEKMSHIKGKLLELEEKISRAEVIDPKNLAGQTKIMFGAHVTVLEVDSDKKITYQIVGEHESDIKAGKISVASPIARSLIGKLVDTQVIVRTPKGEKEYEILEVVYK